MLREKLLAVVFCSKKTAFLFSPVWEAFLVVAGTLSR